MSKLAIFLCAVLVASAVNASQVSDALVSAQAAVDEFIGTIIYVAKYKFDNIRNKTAEHVVQLQEAARLSNENAYRQIQLTLEEVQTAIDKLDGSEINDFNELVSHLEKTGLSGAANMSACADDKLATGRQYSLELLRISKNVLANLTAIRETNRHCVDNVVDIETAAAAIECINTAELKAAWVEAKTAPSAIIEMTKISNSIISPQLELAQCEITSGFVNFFDETIVILLRIHEMQHGARPDMEEVKTEKSRLSTKDASTSPVKLVWAEEGDDVELPCDITPPTPTDSVNMVLWFKDTVGIPLYSLDARATGNLTSALHWAVSDDLGRRTYFQVGDGQRSKLKVTKVTPKDQGTFRCRVDFVDSPTRNFRVNLTLVVPPKEPIIYDAQSRVVVGVARFYEGYDLQLTCQVSDGRPKPSVTWWKDNKLIDGVVDIPELSDIAESSSKFTRNHLVIEKVTRSLWGSKLECRVQSAPMAKPIRREVPLDIYLKPATVRIHLHEEQIMAGRPIAARCETWGSSPAATIVWSLGGMKFREPHVSTTQRSNSTVSRLAIVLDREDDGKELTCTAVNHNFPGGDLKETRILRVAYAPLVDAHLAAGYVLDTLREGDDLKLICDIQSNPSPTSIVWYHNDTRLEHDVVAGTLIAANTLTLRALNLGHSGGYSCHVRNAVGEAMSRPVNIYMKYAPRCRTGYERNEIAAAPHETLRLHCMVEAEPSETVRFSWTYNGSRGDVLPIPNSRAQNKGLSSVLEYVPLADGDYGTLACWASNSVGRQQTPCTFNVIPAKAPQRPADCSVHNVTSALEVNCVPGSDGGLPQHFLLEVRSEDEDGRELFQTSQTLQTPQSDQGAAGEAPPIYQERNPRPSFHLHDLEPGLDYTVAVYAVNGRGRSEPALLRNIRVSEPLGNKLERSGGFVRNDLRGIIPEATSENMIMILGVIGGASVILVGIGILIGVVVCRKRTGSPIRAGGPDDFTTPTYVSAQRVEPRVRYGTVDRRRSQRTSLYIEESRNDPDLLPHVEIELQR